MTRILTVLLSLGVASAAHAQSGVPTGFEFDGAFVSLWTPTMAEKIAPDETTRLPLVLPADPVLAPDLWVWDSWPLLTREGQVAEVNGFVVLFALTAPRDVVPGQRHGLARWGYFYRRAGEPWSYGGDVFPEGTALGERQWAGSAVIGEDGSRVTFYYTALGELPPLPGEAVKNPDNVLPSQEIAEASATIVTGDDEVSFQDFSDHRLILAADGTYYVTAAQAEELAGPYIFRDPAYYRDASGSEFLLFSATTAFVAGRWNGAVALAQKQDDGSWRLLPPILISPEVNSQLERPHIVCSNGLSYLFFTSHFFTFAEDQSGPTGLFGFVTDAQSVRGYWRPLNESGLVLANPTAAPLQLYSFLVLSGGSVLAFVNYYDLGDVTLAEIGDQSEAFQKEHFGGTPAPLVRIVMDGARTRIAGALTEPPQEAQPAGTERR